MATQMGSESRKRERGMNGGTSADTTTNVRNQGPQGDRLQEAATGLADQAGRTVEAQASTLMTKAGEQLEQVARAIRDAGNNMRQERPEIASYADTTAERVEEAATYLRDHDAREIVDTAQDFARRQPAIVVAGGLAAGLLIGRFLRSGQQPYGQRSMGSNAQYGSTSDTSSGTESASTGSGARRTKARAGH